MQNGSARGRSFPCFQLAEAPKPQPSEINRLWKVEPLIVKPTVDRHVSDVIPFPNPTGRQERLVGRAGLRRWQSRLGTARQEFRGLGGGVHVSPRVFE